LTHSFFSKIFPLVLTLILLLVIFHAFLAIPAFHQKPEAFLLKRSERARPWIQKSLSHLSNLLSLFAGHWGTMCWGIVLSFVWQAVFILRVQVLAESLSIPFDDFDMAWMASLVLLFQVLPVSFNGIGLRESAYAYMFSVQGVSPEKGVLLGLLLLSQVLILAVFGALLQWRSEPAAEANKFQIEMADGPEPPHTKVKK
jgi:hypothetical protein